VLIIALTGWSNKFTIQRFLIFGSDRPDRAASSVLRQSPMHGMTPVSAAAIKPKKH
jgi:hypothetical protein